MVSKFNIYNISQKKQNLFGAFFSKPNLEIFLNEVPKRRKVYLRNEEGKRYTLPAFYDKEDVTGEIAISLTSKKFDHSGIKIELLGLIECA